MVSRRNVLKKFIPIETQTGVFYKSRVEKHRQEESIVLILFNSPVATDLSND
jgi:hypothetical protein